MPSTLTAATVTVAASCLVPAAPVAAVILEHSASRTSPSFSEFVTRYGRTYVSGTEEFNRRRGIYEAAAEKVDEHNARPDKLWVASAGRFADFTVSEMAQYHGWVHDFEGMETGPQTVAGSAVNLATGGRQAANLMSQVPLEKSWSHLEAIKNVRDQGHCGSCWAVSALKVVEAHYEIWKNKTAHFSAQEVVACSENPQHCGGTGGCHGAHSGIAFQYVLDNGIVEEPEFPYTAEDMECPKMLAGKRKQGNNIGMLGWERTPENLYEPMMRTLVMWGPVVVSIAASSGFGDMGFAYYDTGVFDLCKPDAILNHAMVMHGFGHDTALDVDFWHLQNSWGIDWGEHGNMRVIRRDGIEGSWCGTDDEPLKGSACPGGPPTIPVCGSCGLLYKGTFPRFVEVDEKQAELGYMAPKRQ